MAPIINRVVIGVDEAGRGPLAGPVYAAAVILPTPLPSWVDDVKDSKKLSAPRREKLSRLIEQDCLYAIRDVGPNVVDEMNILYATLYTMKCAVDVLFRLIGQDTPEAIVLIDGNKTVPLSSSAGEGWWDLPWDQSAIPDGDNLNKSIAAASILAKVHRDKYMVETVDKQYPEYGFSRHKGYGTKEHREAIKMFGITPVHRKTFGGVKEYV